jgi:prophage antirepressor-like protein
MNQLEKLFNYQGQEVRTFVNDGDICFVAKDVCDVLEISNSRDALSRLDDDEKGVVLTDTLGGRQMVSTVNEYGLYNLVLSSRKKEAKEFKRWITHKVIPSIRKTGSYQKQPKSQAEMLLLYAQQIVEQEQKVKHLETQLSTVNHRLDNIDRIDTVGDLQQRLNAMVRRYAQQEGLTFPKAWREFRSAFNTAYRTNLKNRISHYSEKHGIKSLTVPQYLSLTNNLEDAIRVADKMLNQAS